MIPWSFLQEYRIKHIFCFTYPWKLQMCFVFMSLGGWSAYQICFCVCVCVWFEAFFFCKTGMHRLSVGGIWICRGLCLESGPVKVKRTKLLKLWALSCARLILLHYFQFIGFSRSSIIAAQTFLFYWRLFQVDLSRGQPSQYKGSFFLYVVLQPLFQAGNGAIFDRTSECWKNLISKCCRCK